MPSASMKLSVQIPVLLGKKWRDAGTEYMWTSLVSSLPHKRLGFIDGWSQKGHHLCPFC
jgi:hypothetical protein